MDKTRLDEDTKCSGDSTVACVPANGFHNHMHFHADESTGCAQKYAKIQTIRRKHFCGSKYQHIQRGLADCEHCPSKFLKEGLEEDFGF